MANSRCLLYHSATVISECILEGERIRLRPVAEGDLPHFVRWLADPDNVLWAIDTLDGRLIGTVELRITPRARRAEMGIAVQDKSQWNKGYGTEAVRLVLGYAFGELGLNRVELTVDEENARAVRCYRKCGFLREGLQRAYRLRQGKPVNAVLMGLLREEFKSA